MMFLTDLLRCPDTYGALTAVGPITSPLALLSETTGLVFPVDDGIPIVLPIESRNRELERPLVRALRKRLCSSTAPQLQKALNRTEALLGSTPCAKSWEWEDEEYWTSEYASRALEPPRNWNDRLWQRRPFVERLRQEFGSLATARVLDVGCGEGQNFRALIAPHCSVETLYVAADISLAGLRLNRKLNGERKNAYYVLCTADCLPFRSACFDIICCFGILHHTRGKAAVVPKLAELLRSPGFLILHEVLNRPTGTSILGLAKGSESAHEDRIDRAELVKSLEESLTTVIAREFHTPAYSLAFKLFGHHIVSNKSLFDFVSAVDTICMRLLSGLPLFRAASMLALLRDKSPALSQSREMTFGPGH